MKTTRAFLILIFTSILTLTTDLKASPSKDFVIQKYADLVYQTYKESLDQAIMLDSQIQEFVNSPSLMGLEATKKAWIQSRAPYGQSEVFRFYNGPIDRESGPEGQLNAWPLDENYIDYVLGSPQSGIINNVEKFPKITAELLLSLNEREGEKNISTGYHAIEFLLWGQDFYSNSAGQRSFTDYIEGKRPHAKRRGEYLKVVSQILVTQLKTLVNEWRPNENNYRAYFLSLSEDESIKNILTGIVYLLGDELSGERMYVAWETGGQEDEHSCFSDMTHMDILWNYQGVENIARHTQILSLPELKTLSKKIQGRMLLTKKLLSDIPAPFDQAIMKTDSRVLILQGIESLELLAEDFVEVSKKLGSDVRW